MITRRQTMFWLTASSVGLVSACAHASTNDDFFTAIIRDNASAVTSLLQRGFDPNTLNPDGQPALVFALQKDSLKAFDALLQSRKIKVEMRNKKGESALMIAAIKGNLEAAKALIARDGDVNKTDWTPLHYAASGTTDKAVPMIELLLEKHAYIDAASPNGTTPLMMAVRYGTADAARLLIAEGADPTIKNEKGLTAIDFARQAERNDMVQAVTEAINKRRQQPSTGRPQSAPTQNPAPAQRGAW
ncbi:ankyrin repeat domain-containing protein [Diaphorobacter aerolatus]|uniref:Ankyrin repeat domain-containing protein n=1 Tax=Diaphorobacter aerolatus TaxID=1288495 RepID=A0A7H0GK85_9BURK|nr:ankyrin repeat domain-containing protein [Diaphorobacter aerolatus]QNP48701.1 ankyrin repeat domain-containing protein [Diaphorobacter aerolatus]